MAASAKHASDHVMARFNPDDVTSRPPAGSPGGDAVVVVQRSAKGNWEDYQRSRSYPRSLGLLCGAFSSLVLWISTGASVLSLVMIFSGEKDPWSLISMISLAALLVSLVITLVISLTQHCPLCHGTPLHSRSCPKHRLAQKWPLLTYRATAVLKILTTFDFRCMYCGTPFRLFKKSSRQR